MTEQIFELAKMHGIRVMGVATVEDHRVKTVYIDSCMPRGYGDPEAFGQLGPRKTIALGLLLQQFGEAMLSGELRHNANKVER